MNVCWIQVWPGLRFLVTYLVLGLVSLRPARSPADDAPSKDKGDNTSVGWRMDQQLCGINATYVFLKLYGCNPQYDKLKNSLPVDDGGTSIKHMADAASQHGIRARVVQTDFRYLAQIPYPAIAHLEKDVPAAFPLRQRGHYVVLLGINDVDGVRYVDGTSGRIQTQELATFFREWSGYLLVVDSRSEHLRLIVFSLVCIGFGAISWRTFSNRRTGRLAQSHDRLAKSPPQKI